MQWFYPMEHIVERVLRTGATTARCVSVAYLVGRAGFCGSMSSAEISIFNLHKPTDLEE